MLDGFSDRARAVVATATIEARVLGHPIVGTEHLLLGLLADRDGGSGAVLRRAGASLEAARHKVVELGAQSAGDVEVDAEADEASLTPRAQRALERAGRFARNDRAGKVGTDHVLLGVLDVEGLGCQVLRGLGVDVASLREAVASARAAGAPAPVEQTVDDAVAPLCPSCGAQLDASLAARVLHPQRETGTAMRVLVLYCGECGTALGYLPP